ncbi:MAG: hypothetical protein HC905_11590 [Bacteroidales bacterium]|nr:hypothetical protein [Bacteroidales bacterium]
MLKKILDNPTLMSWSKAIVNFGSAIFVLPIILAVYTPVEQSFWFIINSIIGFALLADSGFGSVLVRAVSYFKSGADFLPKNRDEYDNAHKIESDDPNFKKITDLISTTQRIYFFCHFWLSFCCLQVVRLLFGILWNLPTTGEIFGLHFIF